MQKTKKIERRSFLKSASVNVLGMALGGAILSSSCSKQREVGTIPPMLSKAPKGKVLRAGVVGCGSRGTGAAVNFLKSGDDVQIVALADVFKDRIVQCRNNLKKEFDVDISDANCFVGFDSYIKLLASDVDVVILATPPHFRPDHFESCVEASKHVFMEKPIAVDPVGVRRVMIAGEKAKLKKLTVVTGTVKRHQKDYIDIYKKVCKGEIGEIISANSYYNVGKLWHKKPRVEWSEMECMLRDWVNWCWLSGDHIVEQNIHNLDVVNWFVGGHPVKALGVGARQRRLTGDQYDFFSIDYSYDNDVHLHNMCRQINGCSNSVSDVIRGTKGYVNPENTIYNADGSVRYSYDYPINEDGVRLKSFLKHAYDQEHVNLVTSIRENLAYNDTKNCAEATMTAIMGRVSAYTGKIVTWDEMMNSDLRLGPKRYVMGDVKLKRFIPTPGM